MYISMTVNVWHYLNKMQHTELLKLPSTAGFSVLQKYIISCKVIQFFTFFNISQ